LCEHGRIRQTTEQLPGLRCERLQAVAPAYAAGMTGILRRQPVTPFVQVTESCARKSSCLIRFVTGILQLAHGHVEVERDLLLHLRSGASGRGEGKTESAAYTTGKSIVRRRHSGLPLTRCVVSASCNLEWSVPRIGSPAASCFAVRWSEEFDPLPRSTWSRVRISHPADAVLPW